MELVGLEVEFLPATHQLNILELNHNTPEPRSQHRHIRLRTTRALHKGTTATIKAIRVIMATIRVIRDILVVNRTGLSSSNQTIRISRMALGKRSITLHPGPHLERVTVLLGEGRSKSRMENALLFWNSLIGNRWAFGVVIGKGC